MYVLLFAIGFVGFLAMAVLGMHHGGATHSHSHLPTHGHPHLGHGHQHTHDASDAERGAMFGANLLSLLSPLHLFAYAMGAGATGMIFAERMGEVAMVIAAIAGALFFDFAMVRPLMGFLLRFAGTPSEGLEGTVAHSASAITGFDEQGRGLVTLVLDGQNVQLLAQLDPAEFHHGTRIYKGDEVVVLAVDQVSNTCRVTRELA